MAGVIYSAGTINRPNKARGLTIRHSGTCKADLFSFRDLNLQLCAALFFSSLGTMVLGFVPICTRKDEQSFLVSVQDILKH